MGIHFITYDKKNEICMLIGIDNIMNWNDLYEKKCRICMEWDGIWMKYVKVYGIS